jgi:hypothetical protein
MNLEFLNFLTGETRRQRELALWNCQIDARVERARMEADIDMDLKRIEIDFKRAMKRIEQEKRARKCRRNRKNRNN